MRGTGAVSGKLLSLWRAARASMHYVARNLLPSGAQGRTSGATRVSGARLSAGRGPAHRACATPDNRPRGADVRTKGATCTNEARSDVNEALA